MSLPVRSWPHKLVRLPINGSGIAALVLAPAIAGRIIRVIQYNLTVSGSCGLEFRSDTTPLSGRLLFVANGQASEGTGGNLDLGVFQCEEDEDFIVDVDAAVSVQGNLEIVYI